MKRAFIVLSVALAILLAIAGVTIGPYLFAPNAYEGTPSIEARADYRAPALMRAAWSRPVAASYRRAPFEFQHNQSFCGPTSVANLLHSIGIAIDQDAVIAGTGHRLWFGQLVGGLTLDELASILASRAHRRVIVVRDPTLDQFRALMQQANDPARRVIVNFDRGSMFGRGHGHFSPVLGYLPDRGLVLVGDVNAAYRPYLAPVERLWRAIDTADSETGKERGLLIVDALS